MRLSLHQRMVKVHYTKEAAQKIELCVHRYLLDASGACATTKHRTETTSMRISWLERLDLASTVLSAAADGM
jgi:hypothetical protein